MITDDELKQWADALRELSWSAPAIPSDEFVRMALAATYRLVTEYKLLNIDREKYVDYYERERSLTSQLSDENTALKAEVERLQDESRGYWLDAALLEKENTALKAEVERLREYEADCDTYEGIFRHVLIAYSGDPALGAAAKVRLYFDEVIKENMALKAEVERLRGLKQRETVSPRLVTDEELAKFDLAHSTACTRCAKEGQP